VSAGRLARVLPALAACALAACARGPAPPAAAPSAAPAQPTYEGASWGRYRSARFDLALALPDGGAWKIDDHTTRWLDAKHAPSRSRVRARLWREDRLVTRAACLAQAREWDPMLPEVDEEHLLDDRQEPLAGTQSAVEVKAGLAPIEPGDPVLRGYVLAVAADVRRCVVVAYDTEATGETRERIVGARLALVADRLVKSLVVGSPLRGPGLPMSGH
jgi:hypothetical protein